MYSPVVSFTLVIVSFISGKERYICLYAHFEICLFSWGKQLGRDKFSLALQLQFLKEVRKKLWGIGLKTRVNQSCIGSNSQIKIKASIHAKSIFFKNTDSILKSQIFNLSLFISTSNSTIQQHNSTFQHISLIRPLHFGPYRSSGAFQVTPVSY